jgi:hypothetical protein
MAEAVSVGTCRNTMTATSKVVRLSPGFQTAGERDDAGSLEYVVPH